MIQNDIFNKFSKEFGNKPLNNIPLLQFPPIENPTKNISKPKDIDKPKKNKEKFIIRKRGRKNKKIINNFNPNLKIRVHNKFCDDNIRRKIKGLYNNYIIKSLNNLMKKLPTKNKKKFVKINIRSTKDLSIEYNKILLGKKIKDIIVNISSKYANKNNNKDCIKFIESQKNNEEIIKLMNYTYKDFYINYYLKSSKKDSSDNSYEAHKEKILESYGKEYLEKFVQNTENFIEFYTKGKQRKPRKEGQLKSIDIPVDETSETTSNKEIKNDGDENALFNKKMISSYAQTDICNVNSKLISFS